MKYTATYLFIGFMLCFSQTIKAFTVSPIGGPTNGGITITLTAGGGENFGTQGANSLVLVGTIGVGTITLWSNSTITFILPQGVGGGLHVTVMTNSGMTLMSSNTFSYNLPELYVISPGSGPTSGGTMVTLTGNNFGPSGTPATVTIDGNPATSVTVVNHTSITCITPPGTGFNRNVIITVSGQSNSPIPIWNYAAPIVSSITPAFGPTIGGTMVTILGANFGPPGTPAQVFIDGSAASSITVINHFSITCMTPAGAGFNQNVIVSVSGQSNAPAPIWNYTSPLIASISPSIGPTMGGTLVTITGTNFGPAGTPAIVTIGSIQATSATVTSHTQLTCLTPAGSGVSKNVQVTIEGQQSNQAPIWSYQAPELYSISPANGTTSGGTLVTLTGNNFGPPGSSATVTIDGNPATNVTVVSHTSITCLTPPGTGLNRNVIVSLSGQPSAAVPIWSYAAPTISSISPSVGPTIGGTMITINGTNFGPPGTPALVIIDGNPASSVTVVSHVSITCITPSGAGLNQNVIITVSGQSNPPAPIWNYTSPLIASISPSVGPTSGGTMVTITGTNFGPVGTSAIVTIGSIQATNVMVTSHTQLTCVTPAGSGIGKIVQVTIEGQQSNLAPIWSYQAPMVFSISPNVGPTVGGTMVTIGGSNFGPPGTLANVMIGDFFASNVTIVSHNLLTCLTPSGTGANRNVVVSVGGQSSGPVPLWSYSAPLITSISPSVGPTIGGTMITIAGSNFGPPGLVANVLIDGILATNVSGINDTSITCITPPGIGMNKNVIVIVHEQSSASAPIWSYQAPTVSSITPDSGPEQGGTLVTIIGDNFGPPGTPIAVLINNVAVGNLSHQSHTLITFTTPPGMGSNLPVQIIVDGLLIAPAPTYSYILIQSGSVGIGTNNPDSSAALDVSSSTQGILLPRMSSAERNAIMNPAQGLLVYDTNENAFYYYNGSMWKKMSFE